MRPLLTLERVQVCKRDGHLLAPSAPLPAADEQGMALWHKLMIFSSEAAQHGGQPVHQAMVRRLRSPEVRRRHPARDLGVPATTRPAALGRHAW